MAIEPESRVDVRSPEDLLFGLPTGHPYYIFSSGQAEARRYDEVGFTLCHALNMVGEQAYLGGSGWPAAPSAGEGREWRTAELTAAILESHFLSGRTPIAVTPPGGELDPSDALTVCLSGLLDEPRLASPRTRRSDLIFASSRSAAASVPGGAELLPFPVYDPTFWRPDPQAETEGPCACLPRDFGDRIASTTGLPEKARIVEAGGGSHSRFRLRELLCTSSHLYAFADVGLADRARLCGCAVVVRSGSAIAASLAEGPHGLLGCTIEDDKAALTRARAEISAFRTSYVQSFESVAPALTRFVSMTQSLAASRMYTRRLPLVA